MGDSSLGGVSATAWMPFGHKLFPYKLWPENTDSDSSDSDVADNIPPAAVVQDACSQAAKLALEGIPISTNRHPQRPRWTDYEKRRLNQSLLIAARWTIHANTGTVFAKGCLGTTTSRDGTCSACIAVSRLPGLRRGIRRARERARLPPEKFAKWMAKRIAYTPLIRTENAASAAQASLLNPRVVKILTSKATYGPIGVFLSLYQQGARGELKDEETFLAISNQLSERVTRSQDPTGRAMHGMRYDPTFVKFCTLMRSYGPRSGAQYDLMSGMTGAISQRQMRRRAAKSATKMVSAELCAENLAAALDFAKIVGYDGPWIAAGDGTKLRPLLTVSSEFSEKDSAHVVGSTLPLSETLFKTSEEQSRIISRVDKEKQIATQVWVIAIKIPLPGMPVFPVAFIPNKGKMKGTEYRDHHLKLRELCGAAGLKLLASGADGAKSEVNAQSLMINAKTPERLSYTYEKYGVFLSCPVYADTGPHVPTTDPDHGRKTARNNFLYGTHLLILGFLFLCHAVLMFLLNLVKCPLYVKDIFNPDKQDDGAARRMFTNVLFSFLVGPDGDLRHPSLEGLFILTFIFGELFDAWMSRSMSHIERVVCVFRARHFFTIWRYNIVDAGKRYPDLFQTQSSFLADSSFNIMMRLCDQFILLTLAHLEFYPTVPFMPWHHGTHFLEHFFGIARSFIADFSFGQFIEMYKHILIRQRILSTGQYKTKKEKDSNNGYCFDFIDSNMKPEEVAKFKDVPSRADIDRACEIAWNEAAALASQFAKMQIPTLPLSPSDLHPNFRTANGGSSPGSSPEVEDADVEESQAQISLANNIDASSIKMDTIRIPRPQALPIAAIVNDSDTLPGSSLSPAQALAHASHHVLTEQYLADQADECEEELVAIEQQLEANPDSLKNVSGRILIAALLNPVDPPFIGPQLRPIPSFLNGTHPILRQTLALQRTQHCAGTNVHSETDRRPETDVRYLGGKFSLNHAAHHLKEAVQQSEGLRNDTAFQKARLRRWIAVGPPVEWKLGCNLHISLGELTVPHIQTRGINSLTVMSLDSLVVMRSRLRVYLGKVKGIYRYGSVSGKHESFTDAETVDGLSYLSLEVYEQLHLGRNFFQHIAPSTGTNRELALFTHAPISELVYLLSGATLRPVSDNADEIMFKLSAGDNGWECWQKLTSDALRRTLHVADDADDTFSDEEDDYDEPEEGSKKRKPKPPRGASKRSKSTASNAKAPKKPNASNSRPKTLAKARGGAPKGKKGAGGAKKAKK
ncbi:hypothetical protein R3P38DRAFT_2670220 [Favolaschia claudopus]|uniref:Uncharacterized protein n=1 Tax=Favolaschia claudopus TaxID=2862362 RepID=A0AAV9Z4Y8_9AGAR